MMASTIPDKHSGSFKSSEEARGDERKRRILALRFLDLCFITEDKNGITQWSFDTTKVCSFITLKSYKEISYSGKDHVSWL
jgi:hypothetical protein